DICEGLQFIHNQNKMHCDVKPANILIDHQGRATLVDHDFVTSSKMKRSSIHGTPAYMAPETRARYNKQQLPASDMFALGLILLELRAKVLEDAAKKKWITSIAKTIKERYSPLGDNFQSSFRFDHNAYLINDRELFAYALIWLGEKEGPKEFAKLKKLESLIRSLLKDSQDRPTAVQTFEELSAIGKQAGG
ncbi:MAG: protein kinase, partial [Chlamydiia bacterium]|nr:protein kinase [Chlamydiia bacterium]